MQEPVATEKVHLNKKLEIKSTQEYRIKNIQSFEDVFLDQEPTKKLYCGAVFTPFTPEERVYSDLAGLFIINLSQVNQYMIVIYNFDSNKILVEPFNSRQSGTVKTAWFLIDDKFTNSGVTPKLYLLDK